MRKISVLICFFLLYNTFVSGQKITGNVYDAKTKDVVVGASVFYDGTSIGTVTDLEGRFTLDTQKKIQASLVIKFIGYQTIYLTNPKENIDVYLEENVLELDEVVLEPDTWSRRKKLQVFRREFLGKGSHKCTILNEKDIRLYYKKSANILYAYADIPIQISNKKLRYNILYDLLDFEVVFHNNGHDETSVKNVFFAGTSFFKDVAGKRDNRISKLRNKAFSGSSLHLFRSLYQNKTKEEGFDFFQGNLITSANEVFRTQMQDNGLLVVGEMKKRINIRFDKEHWSFLIAEKPFAVDYLGNYSMPDAVLIGGKMGQNRMGRMLPLDYGLTK